MGVWAHEKHKALRTRQKAESTAGQSGPWIHGGAPMEQGAWALLQLSPFGKMTTVNSLRAYSSLLVKGFGREREMCILAPVPV